MDDKFQSLHITTHKTWNKLSRQSQKELAAIKASKKERRDKEMRKEHKIESECDETPTIDIYSYGAKEKCIIC